MHLLDNESGIPRIDHSGKPHLNGPCETEWNQRLASTNNSETSTILPRIWELLLMIYGNLTRPLNDLLRKDERFEWTPEWQDAFDTLKQCFTKSPVLLMPDSSKPFVLEMDASLFASRAILQQQDNNGNWHPCAYLSKSFNDMECNYNIWDRELLAVIRALTEWRHYLQGSLHTVTLLSNHQNLAYFRKPQWLNRWQARWSLLLTEYDLKLVHIPRTKMIQSDTLSWRPDLCPGNNQDNVDKTLLPDGLFINAFTLSEEERVDDTEQTLLPDHLFLNTLDLSLHTLIVSSTNWDHIVSDVLTALQTNGTPLMKSALSDWQHKNGIVFYKDKCYVPNDIRLRQEIVKWYHNLPPMGHPGHLKTLELLQCNYWWPGMHTFVKKLCWWWYDMIMQRHGFEQFCLLNPAKICKTTELQLLGYKVRDVINT